MTLGHFDFVANAFIEKWWLQKPLLSRAVLRGKTSPTLP